MASIAWVNLVRKLVDVNDGDDIRHVRIWLNKGQQTILNTQQHPLQDTSLKNHIMLPEYCVCKEFSIRVIDLQNQKNCLCG